MKVLLLSRYDRLGASSRLRTMQYMPALAHAGIEVHVAPLFDDEYLHRKYAGKATAMSVLVAFGRRLRQLISAKDFDLVWLEKEALPWIPWPIEQLLLKRSPPIVSDYDDAIFHRYDRHPNGLVRWCLGAKIDRLMAASALVIAGNAYLAGRAKAAGAKEVAIMPTVIDEATYSIACTSRCGTIAKIGWIGTPSTWAAYVAPMFPLLMDIAEAADAVVRTVGAGPALPPHRRLESADWSEEREVELIQSMDIGIMPLADSPWARGKCGYKLIQYMGCGLPVVASPVGVNAEIVDHGVNGFLASSEGEWREALMRLLTDPELRRTMGEAGRLKVEREYSLDGHGPKMADLLRRAAQDC